MTHATATTLHEDLLSRSDLGAIHQPFPSRDNDERQCRGLAHRQLGGLQSQQISIHRRIFCERALDSSDSPGHPINLVTRPKFRDVSADLFDVPSQVDAKNCREWMASVRRCASTDLGIERIYAARHDPHQDLTGFWYRPWHLGQFERGATFLHD